MSTPRKDLADYWERAGRYGGDDRMRPVIYVEAPRWMSEAADRIQRDSLARVIPLLAAREPVVELGCGTGRWQDALRRAGARPVGIDRSSAMLAKARAAGAGRLVRGATTQLPIRSAWAGAILSVTVLQHTPPPDQQAALEETRRIARDGAMLCLLERIGRHGAWHVFPRSPDGWIRAAERAGWTPLEWSGVEFLPAVRALRSAASMLHAPTGEPRPEAAAKDPDEAPPSGARAVYWRAMRAATAASLPLEPWLRRVLPGSAATHGLFLFTA